MKNRLPILYPSLIVLIAVLTAPVVSAGIEAPASAFEVEYQKLRYQFAYDALDEGTMYAAGEGSVWETEETNQNSGFKRKSPMKAFLLSMAVPGLGQYYYGARIKPFIFAGIEAAALFLHFKWDSKGDDMVAEFEQYNRFHWSQNSYEQKYLNWAYNGITDDDALGTRVSHHLPDSRSEQQYYEMTGKYDQFAWGWDDAVLNGNSINDYDSAQAPPRIVSEETTPYSARRFIYEGMRHDANRQHAKATDILFVSMANRLAAGFEAYFTTRKQNRLGNRGGAILSEVKIKPSLKSVYTRLDTPWLRVAYSF